MRSSPVRSALAPVLVAAAIAGPAGAVHAQGTSSLDLSSHWATRSSRLEAVSLETRPGPWEPRGEEHKHRRGTGPMSLADVREIASRLAMKGSPLGSDNWSPYPSSRWPRAPLRGPPPPSD